MSAPSTKKVSVYNAERWDVKDEKDSTCGDETSDGYSTALVKRLLAFYGVDSLSRIAEGFRVEIPDQTAFPGDYTIHNGLAIDRYGQMVSDESELDTAKSGHLALANTNYSIEVVFTLTPGDVDERAFFNPDTDNGADPSGDPIPDGREYPDEVATRIAPSWAIVATPTAGFTLLVNPDSVRIPVALLATDNSGTPKITGGTTAAFKTILLRTMQPGDTKAYCVNTRHAPDAFDGNIDGEAVTVVDNDRANNMLTLGPGVASQHLAGTRVADVTTGAPVFLSERGRADLPLPTTASVPMPTSTTQDARMMMGRGNEPRGFAFLQDPYNSAGESDCQLVTEKHRWDALTAIIRDRTFGGMLDPDPANLHDHAVGQSGPPTSYPAEARWFQRGGSIVGARGNTISIGDGDMSMGDLNVSAHADFATTMQRAIDFLGANGGVIYLRRGKNPYDVGAVAPIITGVSANRITIVGEGPKTLIRATGAVAAIVIDGSVVHLENLAFTRSGGATTDYTVSVQGNNALVTMERCEVDGLNYATSIQLGPRFVRCRFTATTGGNGIAFHGGGMSLASYASFEQCIFTSSIDNAGSRAVLLDTTAQLAAFKECLFITTGTTVAAMVEMGSSVVGAFTRCVFVPSSGGAALVAIKVGSSSSLYADTCSSSAAGGFVAGTNVTTAELERCQVTIGNAGTGIALTGATVGKRYSLRRCDVTQTGGVNAGTGIALQEVDGTTVESVRCFNCDTGISITGGNTAGVTNTTLRDVRIVSTNGNAGKVGVSIVSGAASAVMLDGVKVSGLDDSVAATLYGIYLQSTNATWSDITVRDARVASCSSSNATAVYGIRVEGPIAGLQIEGGRLEHLTALNGASTIAAISVVTGGLAGQTDVTIRGVQINDVKAQNIGHGIRVSTFYGLTIHGNKIVGLGTASATEVHGILVGDEATGTSDQFNFTIAHNQIFDHRTTATTPDKCTGIRLKDAAQGGTLDHNVVTPDPNQSTSFGIMLDGIAGAAKQIGQMALDHNVLRAASAGLTTGIYCVAGDADVDRVVSMSGNIVEGYAASAFNIEGVYDLSMTGNVCRSDVAGASGIIGTNVHIASLTGNVVRAQGVGTAGNGIYLSNSSQVTLCGNSVILANGCDVGAGAYGLHLLTCDYIAGAANVIATFDNRTLFLTGANDRLGVNIFDSAGANPYGASGFAAASKFVAVLGNGNANGATFATVNAGAVDTQDLNLKI